MNWLLFSGASYLLATVVTFDVPNWQSAIWFKIVPLVLGILVMKEAAGL